MSHSDSPPSVPFNAISTARALLAAARREGLDLEPSATELDGSGLDFLVLHAHDAAGTAWIVRTPRRSDVIDAARVEARILRFVREQLSTPVPDWRVFADDVIAYPRLPGVPALTVEAGVPTWHGVEPGALSSQFVESFGDALLALRAAPVELAVRAGVPHEPIAQARESLRAQMEQTRALLEPTPAVWQRWLDWLEADALWPTHVVLTHGDLHPGHLLLDQDTRLTGILDWTEAKLADPALDLAMFFGCFGRPALERLCEHLAGRGQGLSDSFLEHVVQRWATFPIVGAAYGLRTGNEMVLEFSRQQVALQNAGSVA